MLPDLLLRRLRLSDRVVVFTGDGISAESASTVLAKLLDEFRGVRLG